MIEFIKYSFDNKGWMVTLLVGVASTLLLGVIYYYLPHLKQWESVYFEEKNIVFEQTWVCGP